MKFEDVLYGWGRFTKLSKKLATQPLADLLVQVKTWAIIKFTQWTWHFLTALTARPKSRMRPEYPLVTSKNPRLWSSKPIDYAYHFHAQLINSQIRRQKYFCIPTFFLSMTLGCCFKNKINDNEILIIWLFPLFPFVDFERVLLFWKSQFGAQFSLCPCCSIRRGICQKCPKSLHSGSALPHS